VETTEIRPKGAYFAKSCPQRVQLDVLQPCEPLPDPPFLQKLYRAGAEYEGETIESVFDDLEGAVVIDTEDADAREWHTLNAIAEGARIIAGGRLPVDGVAHRVGEPDLLVRCGDGYVPVDVKSHKTLDPVRKAGTGTALVSSIESPFFDEAAVDPETVPRKHVGDLLQLAHYRRLLEAAGLAPSADYGNVGGVYGSEGVVVWFDLDAAMMDAPEHVGTGGSAAAGVAGPMSPMERYDLEFAQRTEVFEAAEAHLVDQSVALLAEPIVCSACDMCRWREWCGSQMEEVADLSLISGIGVARRRLYKSCGVDDLHGLAALDWTTAELVHRGVDLDGLMAAADGRSASTSLCEVIPRRKKQLEDLAALGVTTVGALSGLDERTVAVGAAGVSNLATQIELARARVGSAPAYRRRGVDRVTAPRADVEVDVDMESTNDGCYLWGALVSDRRVSSGSGGSTYVSFATWDEDIKDGELVAFGEFWSWFSGVRARASEEGASFRAYCYSRGAEQGQMTRLADRLGVRHEVDAFLGSDEWVDLLEIVKGQLITGRSMGLKATAALAGFSWTVDDAGGTLAMVKYDRAVDSDAAPEGRAAAQQWILEYNEDDVRATAALRGWLDGAAGELPSIAEAP
jgi:predicted RecB family nuclease